MVKLSGVRRAMHPRGRRCSSIKYGAIFSVVAPCPRGASPVSVQRTVSPRTAKPRRSVALRDRGDPSGGRPTTPSQPGPAIGAGLCGSTQVSPEAGHVFLEEQTFMWRRIAMTGRLSCVALIAAAIAVVHGAGPGDKGEWRYYSADNHATKYSPLDQITRDNVAQLRVAWRRPQVDPALIAANPGLRVSNRFTATPIMVDGCSIRLTASGSSRRFILARARRFGPQPPLVPGREWLLAGGAHWGVGMGAGSRGAHLHHARPVSVRTRSENRPADSSVRRPGQSGSQRRPRTAHDDVPLERRAARGP